MWNKIALLFLFSIISPYTYAECKGEWDLKVDNIETEFKSDLSAYIPVYINLSRNIKSCRNPNAFLLLQNNKKGNVKSSTNKLNADILDKNFRALNYVPNKGYALKLETAQQTKFWIKIKDARISPADTYQGYLDAKLKIGNKVTNKNDKIKLVVPSFVLFKINQQNTERLSGNGAFYKIDLGVLKELDKHQINFNLLSNANLNVEVRQKNGSLKNKTNEGWTIPYSLYFGGYLIHKKHIYHIDSHKQIVKQNIPLIIDIGNMNFAKSGQYSDVIEIEIQAKQ